MNIYDGIKKLPFKKQYYIKWKFNLWFDQEKTMSEEELLKLLQMKSLNAFIKWEKTDEYKAIQSLVLSYRSTQDLLEIYNVVSEKAKTGDEKAIKLFMQLDKEIQLHKKQAEKIFNKSKSDVEDDDLDIS